MDIDESEVNSVDGMCGRDMNVAILSMFDNVDEGLIRGIFEVH